MQRGRIHRLVACLLLSGLFVLTSGIGITLHDACHHDGHDAGGVRLSCGICYLIAAATVATVAAALLLVFLAAEQAKQQAPSHFFFRSRERITECAPRAPPLS